jgi:hypothetical protein
MLLLTLAGGAAFDFSSGTMSLATTWFNNPVVVGAQVNNLRPVRCA